MESFEIRSVDRGACIRFSNREPFDTSEPIDYFTVQLTDAHLSASARVYAYMSHGLAEMFRDVAGSWRDFTGPQAWSSLEGEFVLDVTHDGLGHFTISAALRSGRDDRDWLVRSTVMIETAQLDRIASESARFIGQQA
jgi:hypothetical protein